jgi:hypothetical protein
MLERIDTGIEGLTLLKPRTFTDARGFFRVTHEEERFRELTGYDGPFVQDNESRSAKGVLRGLHYQTRPHAQCKLVRVPFGAVLDVCVDLRQGLQIGQLLLHEEGAEAQHRERGEDGEERADQQRRHEADEHVGQDELAPHAPEQTVTGHPGQPPEHDGTARDQRQHRHLADQLGPRACGDHAIEQPDGQTEHAAAEQQTAGPVVQEHRAR